MSYRASREHGPCRRCHEMIDVGQLFTIDVDEDELFAHEECPCDNIFGGMTVEEQRRSQQRDAHRPPEHHGVR